MSDQQPKPTMPFGEGYLEILAALDEVNQAGRGGMDESFLDAQGNKRRFRLEIYGGGPATFLSAWERRADGVPGLRFVERFDEDSQLPPYGELRDRVRAHLATRDTARDPDTGRRQILTGLLRAQLTCDDSFDHLPAVLVDDEILSWEELGELLSTYEGFGLRIEIHSE